MSESAGSGWRRWLGYVGLYVGFLFISWLGIELFDTFVIGHTAPGSAIHGLYGLILFLGPALLVWFVTRQWRSRTKPANSERSIPLEAHGDEPQQSAAEPAGSRLRQWIWLATGAVVIATVGVVAGMMWNGAPAATETTKAEPQASSPSPSSLPELSPREQARSYFKELRQTIDAYYAALHAHERARDEYPNWNGDDRSAALKAERALVAALEDATVGYSMVTPPTAYEDAHALIIRVNEAVIDAELLFIDNVSKKRPLGEWWQEYLRLFQKVERINSRLRVAFRIATAESGVDPPRKLAYGYSLNE